MVGEEYELIPFMEWFSSALFWILGIGAGCAVVGTVFGFLVTSSRHGPNEAFYIISRIIGETIPDFLKISFRRVWAIAKLAMQEAIRRRVLLVAAILFIGAILIGGWYLDSDSEHPEQIYLSFVYFGTQLLLIMLGLMISTFSLPDDIKNKTIYTVTTKPVRACEIVFGRIIGFVLVGTILVTLIWLISYFFVVRGLNHNHVMDQLVDITKPGLSPLTAGRVSETAIKEGETNISKGHRHRVELFKAEDGTLVANCIPERGHTHEVTVTGSLENPQFTFGSPHGNLLAREPLYAKSLAFVSREGTLVEKGTNVGNVWDYRSYIDGGTPARAVFKFEDIRESSFDDAETEIPIDFQLSVFRTNKGSVERRITASLFVRSEQGKWKYEAKDPVNVFETFEYTVQTLFLPRKITATRTDKETLATETREFDLFDDIAADGKFELLLKCNDPGQYIGVARRDVYIRLSTGNFFMNFLGAYFGIWLQLVIIVSLGVMFSTFLSGYVAMFATIVTVVVGLNISFISDVVHAKVAGGGPIESIYRMITQQNVLAPVEGNAITVMKACDEVLNKFMEGATYLAPDINKLTFSEFLSQGFVIEPQRLLMSSLVTLTFFLMSGIIGYFCLKTREIAA